MQDVYQKLEDMHGLYREVTMSDSSKLELVLEKLDSLETDFKEMKNDIKGLTSRMEIMEVKQNGLQSLYAGNSPLKSDLEYTTRNAGLGYNSRQQERIRKFF